MKPIEQRLTASMAMDVIHGDYTERHILGQQVYEEIIEIRGLHAKLAEAESKIERLQIAAECWAMAKSQTVMSPGYFAIIEEQVRAR